MYDVKDIINFFLSKSALSQKKLQKLLYYAYCWVLALLNESYEQINVRLFNERIEAWVHGPVIPSIYQMYKTYGGMDISRIENFDTSVFSSDVLDILNQVWEVYGNFSGDQLEVISHKEYPYVNARNGLSPYEPCDNLILDKNIFNYFTEQSSK